MGRAWRWWGVWVVVGVCLMGAGRAATECKDAGAKGREWKPGAEGKEWTWKDRDECVRTRGELDAILREHKLWVKSDHEQGHQADLSGADLYQADLTGADLTKAYLNEADLAKADLTGAFLNEADLTGAILHGADLTGAFLNEADLTGADLTKAYLNEADLAKADLTGAFLNEADLTEAILHGADLTGAILPEADLTGAILNADLTGAFLYGADLTRADLHDADLTRADLRTANFTGADLRSADLTKAFLYGADLDGALYEPVAQPRLEGVADTDGLDHLRYGPNPGPLVELRKAFQDAGFVQQGRQVTASIHRAALALDRAKLDKRYESDMESFFDTSESPVCAGPGSLRCRIRYAVELLLIYIPRVLFDWTCAWGADWRHPLVLLGWLCLVCGPVYWVGLHFGRVGGIYQIVLDTTVVTKASKELVTRVETGVRWGGRPALRTRTFGQRERRVPTQIPYGNDKKEGQEPKQKAEADSRSRRKRRRRPGLGWGRVGPVLRAEWRALRLAFLFSVLSALDIGFHEFNVGVWARMLLARDFNLKARGWMRVVGGVQSLVGLGLVALSLLSYFGHPFD